MTTQDKYKNVNKDLDSEEIDVEENSKNNSKNNNNIKNYESSIIESKYKKYAYDSDNNSNFVSDREDSDEEQQEKICIKRLKMLIKSEQENINNKNIKKNKNNKTA